MSSYGLRVVLFATLVLTSHAAKPWLADETLLIQSRLLVDDQLQESSGDASVAEDKSQEGNAAEEDYESAQGTDDSQEEGVAPLAMAEEDDESAQGTDDS